MKRKIAVTYLAAVALTAAVASADWHPAAVDFLPAPLEPKCGQVGGQGGLWRTTYGAYATGMSPGTEISVCIYDGQGKLLAFRVHTTQFDTTDGTAEYFYNSFDTVRPSFTIKLIVSPLLPVEAIVTPLRS